MKSTWYWAVIFWILGLLVIVSSWTQLKPPAMILVSCFGGGLVGLGMVLMPINWKSYIHAHTGRLRVRLEKWLLPVIFWILGPFAILASETLIEPPFRYIVDVLGLCMFVFGFFMMKVKVAVK